MLRSSQRQLDNVEVAVFKPIVETPLLSRVAAQKFAGAANHRQHNFGSKFNRYLELSSRARVAFG